jgi:hypothetical protein
MSIIQTLSVRNKAYYLGIVIASISYSDTFAQQLEPLDWPKTFTGQPDFDFRREEILDEIRANGAIEGVETIGLGTMRRLLQTTLIDPFKVTKTATALNATSEEEDNQINQKALIALFGETRGGANVGDDAQLPGFNKQYHLDLSEFADFLENVINQRLKLNKTTLKDRDFSEDLNRIVIQSISTSPVKYAIINNNKLSVGDRFLFSIKSRIYDSEIEALLAPYLPQPESFSKDVYQKYVDIKDAAIEKYKSENSTGKANVVTHNVSITIRDILHRKIKVSVYGHEYELKMKHAF